MIVVPLASTFATGLGSVGDYIGIFAFAFGLIGFAGGAVGYFAKGRGDSIIAYQAKELDLRDQTIKRVELDNAAVTRERDSLKEQNETLTSLAQGSPQLVELTGQIKKLITAFGKMNRRKS